LKIWWLIFSAFVTLWSLEGGVAGFHCLAKLNLTYTFIICTILCIIDFNLYFFLSKHIRLWLSNKWPSVKRWFDNTKCRDNNNRWIKFCHKWREWGLFILMGTIPHSLPFVIAVQEVFRFKHGYWALLTGMILKVFLMVLALYLGIKIIN